MDRNVVLSLDALENPRIMWSCAYLQARSPWPTFRRFLFSWTVRLVRAIFKGGCVCCRKMGKWKLVGRWQCSAKQWILGDLNKKGTERKPWGKFCRGNPGKERNKECHATKKSKRKKKTTKKFQSWRPAGAECPRPLAVACCWWCSTESLPCPI